MADNTARERVYELFVQGKTAKEAEECSMYSGSIIRKYYSDFIIAAAVNQGNDKKNELMQIRTIENELFSAIKKFHKMPDAVLNNKISQLQRVYSKFCAL